MHKTFIGGITTIIVWILMFIFVVIKMTYLFGSDKDFVRIDQIQTDFNALGEVKIQDSAQVFLQLKQYKDN